MVTFPWQITSVPEHDRKYIGLLGLVRLRSITLLPRFIAFGFRIERQLKQTRGVVGYRTAAQPLSLTFFHLSAWIDEDSIYQFVQTQPHFDAMTQLTGQLGSTVFRYWEVDASELPLTLSAELHRIDSMTSAKHSP